MSRVFDCLRFIAAFAYFNGIKKTEEKRKVLLNEIHKRFLLFHMERQPMNWNDKEPSIQFLKNSRVSTDDVMCFDQICLEKFTDIFINYD